MPARRHASKSLSEPRMLARASWIGIGHAVAQVDLRRVVRDELDLLLSQERLEVRPRRCRPGRTGRPRAPFRAARGEVVHDDDAVAVVRWRFAMCDPMKPAPPVTRMFIESPNPHDSESRARPTPAHRSRARSGSPSPRARSSGATRSASPATSWAPGSPDAAGAGGTAPGSSRRRRTSAPPIARRTRGATAARRASSRCTPTAGTSTCSSSTACTTAPTS